MSYVKGTLSKDEEIKEVVKNHWYNYATGIGGPLIILTIICIDKTIDEDSKIVWGVILTLLAIYNFLKLLTTEMVVTNKRVVCRTGIISIKTEELKYQKIESIETKQSMLGRILGYGTLWFSGTGTSKVKFKNIAEPWMVKSRVETIIGN